MDERQNFWMQFKAVPRAISNMTEEEKNHQCTKKFMGVEGKIDGQRWKASEIKTDETKQQNCRVDRFPVNLFD